MSGVTVQQGRVVPYRYAREHWWTEDDLRRAGFRETIRSEHRLWVFDGCSDDSPVGDTAVLGCFDERHGHGAWMRELPPAPPEPAVIDTPKREQWWWTSRQMGEAGWGALSSYGVEWYARDGEQLLAEKRHGEWGAWRDKPPPGPELSDEEVRRYVDALRKQARACRLPPNLQPYTYAAEVIDWALQWDIGQRDRVGHDLLEEREGLSRAIRRRRK